MTPNWRSTGSGQDLHQFIYSFIPLTHLRRFEKTPHAEHSGSKTESDRNLAFEKLSVAEREPWLVAMRKSPSCKGPLCIGLRVRSVCTFSLIPATPGRVRTCASSHRRRDRGQTGPGAPPRPHASGQPSQGLHPAQVALLSLPFPLPAPPLSSSVPTPNSLSSGSPRPPPPGGRKPKGEGTGLGAGFRSQCSS